jgi:hypothetical protein
MLRRDVALPLRVKGVIAKPSRAAEAAPKRPLEPNARSGDDARLAARETETLSPPPSTLPPLTAALAAD